MFQERFRQAQAKTPFTARLMAHAAIQNPMMPKPFSRFSQGPGATFRALSQSAPGSLSQGEDAWGIVL